MSKDAFRKGKLLPRLGILFGLLLVVLLAYIFSSPRRISRIGFWLNASKDHGAFIFAGDSLIARWANLADAFPGLKVANRGLDGDATRNLLSRLDADVLSAEPAALLLMIGTNDLNSGGNSAEVVGNLRNILARVRSRSPALPVVICKLAPRQAEPGRFPERLREVNAAMDQAFASDPLTTLFDTWALFANERGEPAHDDFPDGLHPSPQAYKKWGLALRPLFEKIVRPVTAQPTSA